MNAFDESGLTPLTPQQAHSMTAGVEIDVRLLPLFEQIWTAEEFVEELSDEDVSGVLAAAMRAAYVKGYNDAAEELQQQLQQQGRRTAFQW